MTQPFTWTGELEKFQSWYETTPQRIQEIHPETQIFGSHPLCSMHLKGPGPSTMKRSPLAIRAPHEHHSPKPPARQGAPQGSHWWERRCGRDQQPVLRVTPPNFKGSHPTRGLSCHCHLGILSLCVPAGPLLHHCQWACKSLHVNHKCECHGN